jgi:hypothetical protein
VHAAGRHRKVFGQDDLHAVGVDLHRGRRLDHLLDGLHARPHAGEAAHREGMQAHVQDVLHVAGEEHRQPAGLEDVVALVRGGAALGHVVVTGDGDHAAVPAGAGHVGVLEDVAEQRSTPGPLPYQMPNTPSNLRVAGNRSSMLRAPHRGGRQLLVHAGLEHDVLRLQVLLGLPHAPGRSRPAGCRGSR